MMKVGNLVGLVGWRGMVGSVLLDRMQSEGDFELIEPVFFTTSNVGGAAPAQAKNETTLKDAFDIDALKKCDIVITAQGGEEYGFTFVGRGFDVRVRTPFNESLAAGLRKTAAACVEACPTGALAFRRD